MLGEELFAPAPLVQQITTDGVHLSVPTAAVETDLEPYGR
jgi:hypothetical protein